MNEPPKRQIALKSTNDEGSSNTNMSDEELDNLVLLVKKWRGFRNNRRFQKKDDKGEDKNKKIIYYDCDKPGHKRTKCPNKKKFNKKKALQATWTIVMKMILKKMKFKKKSPTCTSWLLRIR
ncbi:Uncharacterized protein Adt_42670 [Abeliophyllum distichum]|uniref:CCHC-type domain-containing protein n=1 Tax=Abeliophyllum distichum TaxID=126358 RepID=A0ABD1PSA6_9LAMI